MPLSEKTPAIYMFKSKTTGKVYIGSTKDIGARMRQWLYEYHSACKGKIVHNTPIIADMVKYGWDDFKFKIVDSSIEMYDPSERAIREIELIVKYQSILPEYGYNSTIGGESGANKHRKAITKMGTKALFLYNIKTGRISFFIQGTKNIHEKIGCRKDTIPDSACRGKLIKHTYFIYYANPERREICYKYIKDIRDRMPNNGNNANIATSNYSEYKKGYKLVSEYAKELGF